MLADENKTVMQFTGLTYKNGKEIYKGNVLGYSNAEYDLPGHGGKWTMNWRGEVCDEYGSQLLGYRIPSLKDEVIGNVYENPELLK